MSDARRGLVLNTITDGIWCAESHLKMGPGFGFPLRMTIVRLPDGTLWLHSPIAIDDSLKDAIEELGAVQHLVAPNCFHHLHLSAAKERFPDATRYVAPGLAKKLPALEHEFLLDGPMPAVWGDAFDCVRVEGAPMAGELVFFHRPSKTLIVTDLLFNIHHCKGWLSPWIFRTAGAWKHLAQSRLWRMMTRDRQAAKASVEAILAWDFERAILCHGDLVEEAAKQRVEEALSWMRSP